MVFKLTQINELNVLAWIGVVWFAIRLNVRRTSSTLFLIVQRTIILESGI